MILHGESVRTNCALLLCLGRNRNFLRLQYASIHLQSVVVSQTASIYRPNRVRATVGLSLALHVQLTEIWRLLLTNEFELNSTVKD